MTGEANGINYKSIMTFKNFLLFIITITLSMNSVMSILGGVKQTDVRKCRQLLSKIDLGVDSYLRKYVIVSCTEQLVSGKKYTMTVRPTLTSDVHVDIEIWAKLDQTFEITVGEETAENVQEFEQLEGGFGRTLYRNCEIALASTDLQTADYLQSYVVIGCDSKIVAGEVFQMTIVNPRHQTLRRNLVISTEVNHEIYTLESDQTDFLPVTEEQGMPGGFFESDISECEEAIKSLTQEEQAKFDNSRVIGCEVQIVKGKNFKMIIQSNEMISLRARVTIYMDLPNQEGVSAYELSNFETYLDESAKEQMTGALYGQPRIENCFEAIRGVEREKLVHFLNMRLLRCETQVVNGINYKLTLKMAHVDETCSVIIYNQAGTKLFELTETEDEDDCHKKLGQ